MPYFYATMFFGKLHFFVSFFGSISAEQLRAKQTLINNLTFFPVSHGLFVFVLLFIRITTHRQLAFLAEQRHKKEANRDLKWRMNKSGVRNLIEAQRSQSAAPMMDDFFHLEFQMNLLQWEILMAMSYASSTLPGKQTVKCERLT